MEIVYATAKVERFVEGFNVAHRSRIRRVIMLLREYGSELGMPLSKPLGRGLFELRILGNIQIRLIYAFKGGFAVIIHGFIKKTQQTPKRDIEYAIKIFNALQS